MKIRGAEIARISASKSGQAVAEVVMDNGQVFIMPFGHPTDIDQIKKAVQEEVDHRMCAIFLAADLHERLKSREQPPKARKKSGPSHPALWVRGLIWRK